MNDREKNKLTTPGGKELQLYTYVTARERNKIFQALVGDNPVDEEAELNIKSLLGGAEELLKATVYSYDGVVDGVADRLLDGAPSEYDFAVKEAMAVVQGLVESSVPTSGQDSTR